MSGVAEISFVYDSDGKMVIKEEADGTRTLYIGNYLEIEIPSQGTPTPTPTATASQPRTFTATATPTTTMTPTPTATGNPTDTPTATSANTPTITQTPTVTNTPAVTHTPTPTATSSGNQIFADGFESGDFSAWDSSTTDGGDLSVTTGAAMVGTYGMQAVIDDNNAIYVTDETPNGETEYVVRFYFDPNSISMSNNDNAASLRAVLGKTPKTANLYGYTIFFAYKGTIQPAMRVELRYYSGNYQVRAQARKDSLFVNTSYYTISDDVHYIEVAWSAATSPGANNGELTLYIDGVQKESITNIDNDTIYIDRVQLGAVTEVDNGTRGTYYFDAFESRSSGYIGPVAAIPSMQVAIVEPADGALASISYWLLNLLQEIFEWVVTFFQPGSALAGEVQVETAQAMSVVMLEESIPVGQVWKTYYYAGSQRVAMRVNDGETDEVYYLFSDHLGSTSITTDRDGDLFAEMRYTAWGEVRYSSGQTPTDYTYTGQRSEVSSFGLMYYNARWYEPALGRFAEGDTIVPEPGNPLTWDRFAYSFNNPISYIDPSGHVPCFEDGYCPQYGITEENLLTNWAAYYGVTYQGAWTIENKWIALDAIKAVGSAIANVIGGTIAHAFRAVYGAMTFLWGTEGTIGDCSSITAGGCTNNAHLINWMSMPRPSKYKSAEMACIEARNNVVHELAHAFAAQWFSRVPDPNNPDETIPNPAHPYNLYPAVAMIDEGWPESPLGAELTWRQHPAHWDIDEHGNVVNVRAEYFADSFLGWTFNTWGTGRIADIRKQFMTTNMVEWLTP